MLTVSSNSLARSQTSMTISPSPPPPAAHFANTASTPPTSQPAAPRSANRRCLAPCRRAKNRKPTSANTARPQRRHPKNANSPPSNANGELEEVVPMSLIRRRIAERLVSAQQQAALLTTFNEIDMSAVKELRAEYRDAFQAKYGVEARLHVVLRQSRRRRPQKPARAQRRNPRQVRSSTATTTTSASPSAARRAWSSPSFAPPIGSASPKSSKPSPTSAPAPPATSSTPPTSKAARSPSPTAASSARSSPRRS